jgi:predicted nucleic acid-binding protein
MVRADADALAQRTAQLMRLGFRNFDALHVASAESAGADVFATCDDRLLAAARRNADALRVRVAPIVDLAKETLG